jgi:Holliday junction resolvasome RuvABC endonuclease subunit
MTPHNLPPAITFGVHATSHGFGWVAFEGPLAIFDWGTARARTDKNNTSMRRLERLLERFQPETLVLEAFEGVGVHRSQRVARLCRAMIASAVMRGINVAVYGRGDVKGSFAHLGAIDRHDTAQALARLFDVLRPLLPKRRRAWEMANDQMGIFNAAAVVLTHFQHDTLTLLGSLGRRD